MLTDFKKKQKTYSARNLFFLFLASILFLVICILLIIANIRILEKKKELAKQLINLQNQVADIEKSNQNLKKGVAESTDINYMEKIAREELDMQKPGEKVVSFIMPKRELSPVEGPDISQKWFSWLGNFWSWIKNKF